MSPTISSPVCQEQLVEAGKLVERSVETCVRACRTASEDGGGGGGGGELLAQVGGAAGTVSQALGDLLQHVRRYASRGEPIGRYDQATDTIMNVTENIFTSMGDAGEPGREEGGREGRVEGEREREEVGGDGRREGGRGWRWMEMEGRKGREKGGRMTWHN